MKFISLKEGNEKINGITVEIDQFGELVFTRYRVNEYGNYIAETLFEGIKFEDPRDWFDNINKSEKEIDSLREKAIMEVAEKLFPGLKVLYFEP